VRSKVDEHSQRSLYRYYVMYKKPLNFPQNMQTNLSELYTLSRASIPIQQLVPVKTEGEKNQ